jgi:hypothetical protein
MFCALHRAREAGRHTTTLLDLRCSKWRKAREKSARRPEKGLWQADRPHWARSLVVLLPRSPGLLAAVGRCRHAAVGWVMVRSPQPTGRAVPGRQVRRPVRRVLVWARLAWAASLGGLRQGGDLDGVVGQDPQARQVCAPVSRSARRAGCVQAGERSILWTGIDGIKRVSRDSSRQVSWTRAIRLPSGRRLGQSPYRSDSRSRDQVGIVLSRMGPGLRRVRSSGTTCGHVGAIGAATSTSRALCEIGNTLIATDDAAAKLRLHVEGFVPLLRAWASNAKGLVQAFDEPSVDC